MGNTGGDLTHAAKEIDAAIEKQSINSSEDNRVSNGNFHDEKRQPSSGFSKSPSDDTPQLDKIDSQVLKTRQSQDDEEAYAHLPAHEREIIKRQLNTPSVPVSYWTLFRYATRNDLIIIYICAMCAIIAGAIQPLMTVSCDVYEEFSWRP